MTEPLSSGSDFVNLDGLQGPPTFVQIHPPVSGGVGRRRLGAGLVGIVIAAALGWTAYRLTDEPVAPAVREVAAVTHEASPQPAPPDLSPELVTVTIDSAVSSPAWSRASLMDWVAPFDPSANARELHSAVAESET